MRALPDIPTTDLARVVAAVRAIDVGRAELLTKPTPNARVVHTTRLGSTSVARAALVLLFILPAIFLHSTRGRAWNFSPTSVLSAEEFHMNRFQVMAVTGAAAGMTALSSVGAASAQDAVEWRVEDGGNGHWYQVVIGTNDITWIESRSLSEQRGGYLATPTSAAENQWLHSRVVAHPAAFSTHGPWLGGYRNKQGWNWVTGEPWAFTAWTPENPSNDGMSMGYWEFSNPSSASWNDAPESNLMISFVVEYSADCNSDGIVDYGQIRAGELVDVNANNIPDCCEQPVPCTPCLADVDESGAVNSVDLAAVLANWGTDGGKYPRTDVNGDGTVSSADLSAILSAWGPCD